MVRRISQRPRTPYHSRPSARGAAARPEHLLPCWWTPSLKELMAVRATMPARGGGLRILFLLRPRRHRMRGALPCRAPPTTPYGHRLCAAASVLSAASAALLRRHPASTTKPRQSPDASFEGRLATSRRLSLARPMLPGSLMWCKDRRRTCLGLANCPAVYLCWGLATSTHLPLRSCGLAQDQTSVKRFKPRVPIGGH